MSQHEDLDPMIRSSTLSGKKRRRGSASPPRRTKSTNDVFPSARTTSIAQADRDYKAGMLRAFVKGALTKSQQGDLTGYTELLVHFSTTATTPELSLHAMTPILIALTSHISLLDSTLHSELIRAIIRVPWATVGTDREGERLIRGFTGFLGALITTKGEWLEEVLSNLVQGFKFHSVLRVSSETSIPPTWSTYFDRHHTLLSYIYSLIPTLPLLLQTLLTKHFPHKRESELALTVYARNALKVVEWCPGVAARVWEVTLDRIIKLDVEIQVELDDLEDPDEDDHDGYDQVDPELVELDARALNDPPKNEELNEEVTVDEIEIEDISSDDGSVDGLSESSDEDDEMERLKRLKETRAKLDALIWHLFRHLAGIFGEDLASSYSNGRSNPLTAKHPVAPAPATRINQFQILLGIFDRLILPTFQARRAQFLIFWLCSLSPAYTDLFLGLLVSRSLYQDEVPYVRRIAAASYVASFISRASYVTDEQTRTVVRYLTAYIDGVLADAKNNPTILLQQMGSLQIFYTVCQAVMMIFCFRWQALRNQEKNRVESSPALSAVDDVFVQDMELEGEEVMEATPASSAKETKGKWMDEMDVLHGAIFGPLNPLLACYPDVVDMFAKVAHSTKLVFCYSKMSANQHLLSSSGNTSQATTPGLSGLPTPALIKTPLSSIPLTSRQALEDNGLDCYFPFDPYDLPRSGRLIDPLYRQWGDVEKPFGSEGLLSPPDALGARSVVGSFGESYREGGFSQGLLSTSLEGMRL